MSDLIETKRSILKQSENKKAEILTLKHLISIKETAILLNTDFKAEGCTNEKQRTAYINSKLRAYKTQLDWLKYDLAKFTDDLALIDDLLKYKGD